LKKPEPFRVVVADPPWRFGDKLPGKKRGASKHYACLTEQEIARFPLPPIADDALLFLWRVASMQEEALRVMRVWGFTPKSEIVWVKTTSGARDARPTLAMGMGRYVRNAHEVCLIGRRGRASVVDKSVKSVFFAPRTLHSEKPGAFFDIVERLSKGPYVELFARQQRLGWTCFGNEAEGKP
jgi:N6-adenosine-specific RNA methylase IME4